MTDRRKPILAPVAVVVISLLLLALYAGVYLAMVRPDTSLGVDDEIVFLGPPDYHFGGVAAQCFFYPAYFLDSEIVRRGRWFTMEDLICP